MKINIEVDDSLVKTMYQKFCDGHSCEICPAQIILGDEELGCFNKYKKRIFENEFSDIFKAITDIIVNK